MFRTHKYASEVILDTVGNNPSPPLKFPLSSLTIAFELFTANLSVDHFNALTEDVLNFSKCAVDTLLCTSGIKPWYLQNITEFWLPLLYIYMQVNGAYILINNEKLPLTIRTIVTGYDQHVMGFYTLCWNTADILTSNLFIDIFTSNLKIKTMRN